jgi:hypothetical protein
VLDQRELVVEGIAARDAERACGERQVVRPVRERDVEVPALCPGPERPQARDHRAELGDARAAAVSAEQLGVEPVELQEVDRLRVIARSDLDLGAAVPQERDQRPEDQHVGGRCHVDPDLHDGRGV